MRNEGLNLAGRDTKRKESGEHGGWVDRCEAREGRSLKKLADPTCSGTR